ncbi:MAG: patatin-like phospholipase family protein [Bacillota bacterium]
MRIGLALGGGGLRGAAHIGVIKVLQENGITPHMVAGTSAGSIVTALYGAGLSFAKMEDVFRQITHGWLNYEREAGHNLLGRWSLWKALPLGLLKPKLIERVLSRAIGNLTFSQLKLPSAIVATDLHTGKGIVYTAKELLPSKDLAGFEFSCEAKVLEAVGASIAIPGIFMPVKINNRTLVDGGLVDNVPADVLRHVGADKIIAVDLGFDVEQEGPFHNLIEVLLQATDIMGQRISNVILASNADVVLRPQTGSAALWDFNRVPSMVQAGIKEALQRMDEIKATLKGKLSPAHAQAGEHIG